MREKRLGAGARTILKKVDLRHDKGSVFSAFAKTTTTTMAKEVSDRLWYLGFKYRDTNNHGSQIVYKHYQRILSQWPVDLLRPEVSFQKTIQKRIETRLTASATPTQDNVISNQAQATVPTPTALDEKVELEQVNVLYSFLESRYTKKVGSPSTTRGML